MNKFIIVVTGVLVLLAPMAAQTITVVSPNGGETLTKGGSPYDIAWTVRNVDQNVKIVLLREDGERFGLIAENLEPGGSPYRWTVGETRSGEAPAGDYKVRVVSDDGTVKDVSDRAFAIAGAGGSPTEPEPETRPTLRVAGPNGGGSMELGKETRIVWHSENLTGGVDVFLVRNGAEVGPIAFHMAVSGAHNWFGGETIGGWAEPGGGYRIRVKHSGGTLQDDSDREFTIAPATTPRGTWGNHDFVISDPVLETRGSNKGFLVTLTDTRGSYKGDVLISYFTSELGWENAIKEPRTVDLRQDVPCTVMLSNLSPSHFAGKCEVKFVFNVKPLAEISERSERNNTTDRKFCWERGTDGRFFSLRVGPNFNKVCSHCDVLIRPGDVESVSGQNVNVRLEITVQNCGNTAIRDGQVYVKQTWDHGRSSSTVGVIQGVDVDPGNYQILYKTVRLEIRSESHLAIDFECEESGSLDANNWFAPKLIFSQLLGE